MSSIRELARSLPRLRAGELGLRLGLPGEGLGLRARDAPEAQPAREVLGLAEDRGVFW